jgi:hypothetical protein
LSLFIVSSFRPFGTATQMSSEGLCFAATRFSARRSFSVSCALFLLIFLGFCVPFTGLLPSVHSGPVWQSERRNSEPQRRPRAHVHRRTNRVAVCGAIAAGVSAGEYAGRDIDPEDRVATKKQKARAKAAGKEIPTKPNPKKKTSRGK